MQFKHILLFSIKDFNNNKEKDGYFPHDGTVINVVVNAMSGLNAVAVGFTNKR
ncbi:hypothetical protein NRIC_08740 [Enterococcus florum]|uniref:Uncharacterized protein n=1 Tax=Enterococcus florum TaxID=2480627 RepID=A0A4P5PHV7_9ENTE|nr:hypothetical protein [Enterococcus florum]GCF92983.1 hypothetical protein NRIC_08740 [Enterococcus florum]